METWERFAFQGHSLCWWWMENSCTFVAPRQAPPFSKQDSPVRQHVLYDDGSKVAFLGASPLPPPSSRGCCPAFAEFAGTSSDGPSPNHSNTWPPCPPPPSGLLSWGRSLEAFGQSGQVAIQSFLTLHWHVSVFDPSYSSGLDEPSPKVRDGLIQIEILNPTSSQSSQTR